MKTLRPRIATLGASAHGWRPDSQRGSRHERGYGWEWEKTVKRIRQRANDLCEPHLLEGLVHKGTECDHIKPKAQGGTNDDSNLQWCCNEYHSAKTAREDSKGGR